MSTYLTAVDSTLGPEAAFNYMAAFENAAVWDPGVSEATRLTEGPVALGTEFLIVAMFSGRKVPLTYHVTEIDPGSRLVLTAQTSNIRSVDEITVSASGGGSCVTYHANLTLRGALWIANPLLGIAFKKIGDQARVGLVRELNP